MSTLRILESFLLPQEQLQRRRFPQDGPRAGRAMSPTPVVAIDCEMCLSTVGFEPVRLSAVDGEGRVLFDLLARPRHPVVDWHTRFTGLTEADLAEAPVGADALLERLFQHLDAESILVGHGLDNDLRALGFVHTRCVDTLALYDTGLGTPRQSSLRHLARRHLDRVIQQGSHDSVEDARAALELALLRARLVAPLRREEGPGEPTEGPPDFAAVMALFGLRDERVLNLYAFGSRVYGTANERSDHDFIGVVALDEEVEEHLSRGAMNLALYDQRSFVRLLQGASIWAMECLFLPPALVLRERLDLSAHRSPDPALLRASVCMESGYAWSKAMRLLKEGDVYKAQKNVFHAIRFLEYGIQLATEGRITDYGAANHHLAAMRADPPADKTAYRRLFAPLLRARKRDFTRITPYAAPHLLAPPEAPRALADTLDPLHAEGFVVCDADFRRVKVKSRR